MLIDHSNTKKIRSNIKNPQDSPQFPHDISTNTKERP